MSPKGPQKTTRRSTLKFAGAAAATVGVAGLASGSAAGQSELTADIQADSLPAVSGNPITFDAGGSSGDIQNYQWEIRKNTYYDIGFSNEASGVTYQPNLGAGPWTVKLTVQDGNGNTASTTVDFIVYDSADSTLTAKIDYRPDPASSSTYFTFSARRSSSHTGEIVSYQWDHHVEGQSHWFQFGEGETVVTDAKWSSQSIWYVRLTITDSKGRTAQTTRVIDF